MTRKPIHSGPGVIDLTDTIEGSYVEWYYAFAEKTVLLKVGSAFGPVVAGLTFEIAEGMARDILQTLSAPDPEMAYRQLKPDEKPGSVWEERGPGGKKL